MNNIYLYDGSFSSLLTLIYELIDHKIIPIDIKSENDYIPNLIDEPVYLKLENKNEKIKLLKSKITNELYKTIYYAYLSNNINKEIMIYKFIKYSLLYKNQIFYRRNLDSVNEIINMSHKVSMESHHLKGFLRFKKMNNFYYAEMSPTNNIIYIITLHFKERLKNECWIIKDVKREIYAIYDLKKVIYLKKDDVIKLNLHMSSDEELYEDLWKTFFKTVSIKERENRKCQMNHMPKKYWDYMLEMNEK